MDSGRSLLLTICGFVDLPGLFDFVSGWSTFLMAKRSTQSKSSVNKVDRSGVRPGDTSVFVSEFPCRVCHEPVEFCTETKTHKRKATTYKKHCEPHLECIRRRLCEDHYGISELCRSFKFNRTTFYKWIKEHSELKEIIDESNDIQVEVLEDVMMRNATDRNIKGRSAAVRAGEILLKAKAPEKYSDKVEAKVTGEVDYNMSMNSIIEKQRERIRKERAEASDS